MAVHALSGWIPFLLLILPLLPLLLFFLKNKRGRTYNLPPGPFSLPILGNLHQVGEFPHRSLWSLSKKYGPLMHLQLGRVPTLVVSSARMAKEVIKSHDHEFSNRPAFASLQKLSYNFLDVAFAPYGYNWKEMRKICVIELLSPKRVQSFGSVRKEEIDRMIQSISESSDPLNLSAVLPSLTNKIICRSAFGKTLERDKGKFLRVLDEGRTLLSSFMVADFLPWMWWIDVVTGQQAKIDKNFIDLDTFFEQAIEDHLDPKRERIEQEDLIDVLLRVQKDLNLTRDHVKGVLMNILVAGTDTVSTTTVWGMTELIRNTRTMKVAQDEVRRIVGTKEKVDESDLPQLTYLKSVVKETLRLHPPGPLLVPRETLQHSNIDGFDIFPKTLVLVNAMAIGRDPDSWESPEEFLPERFFNTSVDYKGQDFGFIPFGGGRRGCPGIYMGTLVVELVLANLLFCFNWELPAGMKKEDIDVNEGPGLTVNKKNALCLVPIRYISFGNEQAED
ncbi:cytochrome P450 71A9-like [Tasmannia lanceolata]|uniref:cytochrome P450 71A9-like n=1 Tax=Tasmannia lanceolata TaxID=3420 RepID=UPI004063C19C